MPVSGTRSLSSGLRCLSYSGERDGAGIVSTPRTLLSNAADMTNIPTAPLALQLDSAALKSNWLWLAQRSGAAACGAAIKANGYGLGAVETMKHLQSAGCRDF